MSDVTGEEIPASKDLEFRSRSIEKSYNLFFLYGGLLFLVSALLLYAVAAYSAFVAMRIAPDFVMAALRGDAEVNGFNTAQMGKLVLGLGSTLFAPLICLVSAFTCSLLGVRLLRTSGAVATHVIAPQDYALLGPAIAAGNSEAIGQFIRLSSLSGATGTFTKVGLTGLPLATIFLTLILALLGIFNDQFFDLAKLTLGAFLGSFVQRQAESVAPKT